MRFLLPLLLIFIAIFSFASPTLAHPHNESCAAGRSLETLKTDDHDCWCFVTSQEINNIPQGCTADNTENPLRDNFGDEFGELATNLGARDLGAMLENITPFIEEIENARSNQTADHLVDEACLDELTTLKNQLVTSITIDPPSARCVTQADEFKTTKDASNNTSDTEPEASVTDEQDPESSTKINAILGGILSFFKQVAQLL